MAWWSRGNRRPCWVVLAPGSRSQLEREVRRVRDGVWENRRWKLAEGSGGYVAIIEPEPGSECSGDEALASALSRDASRPAYVLWLNDEAPRVQGFVDGNYAGEVAAWPDSVAAQLGCSFPGIVPDDGAPVDLTPQLAPRAAPGELKLAGWTVAQWAHEMRLGSDWSLLLEGASERGVGEILAALDHADAAVRALACRLTRALGVHGLGEQAGRALARLRTLADDVDASVRDAARQAHAELAEAVEREAIRGG